MERVWIYDTTLRDGAQGEGVSFTVADKLEIVRLLDDLAIDYIEGGWPGSNAKDLEFFYELRSLPLKHSRVVAFTSTRRKGQRIEEDSHMQMVLGTGLKHCAVVGKTWDFHVEVALRTEMKENLAMISDTIAFLKDRDIEALFDAEHFFDGYKRNPDYALKALRTAKDAGADWLVLCDTNGGMLPHEIAAAVSEVLREGLGPVSVHAHNDSALAVANSLVAVQAGATQVQGTINGFGERCGNTDLCSLLPNLMLKLGRECAIGNEGLSRLKSVSERLYSITGKHPVPSQPFVGRSAFAHKAGIHVSAVIRDPMLYEHVPPQAVGNDRRVLVSELSGASNVVYRLEQLKLDATPEAVNRILRRVKEAEQTGYVFEEAEASLELLMREELGLMPLRMEQVHTTLERVDEGYSVSLGWAHSEGTVHGSRGVGGTETQALCHAAGLTEMGFSLCNEEVVALTISGAKKRFRARLGGMWQQQLVSTIGIGSTRVAAAAEAVLQALEYILLKMDSSAEVARSG